MKEKELKLQEGVQAGEIIPERAQLEIQRAQKMAEQAIEEKRMQLTAEAQEASQKYQTEFDFDKYY